MTVRGGAANGVRAIRSVNILCVQGRGRGLGFRRRPRQILKRKATKSVIIVILTKNVLRDLRILRKGTRRRKFSVPWGPDEAPGTLTRPTSESRGSEQNPDSRAATALSPLMPVLSPRPGLGEGIARASLPGPAARSCPR